MRRIKLLSSIIIGTILMVAVLQLPSGVSGHTGWAGSTKVYIGPEITYDIYKSRMEEGNNGWHNDEGGSYNAIDTSNVAAGTGVGLYTNSNVQIWVDYWDHHTGPRQSYCKGVDVPFWDDNGWVPLGQEHFVHIDPAWTPADELLPVGDFWRHLGSVASTEYPDCVSLGWDGDHLHQSGGTDSSTDYHHVTTQWSIPNPIDPMDTNQWLHEFHG